MTTQNAAEAVAQILSPALGEEISEVDFADTVDAFLADVLDDLGERLARHGAL